jgi:hypothetical protein
VSAEPNTASSGRQPTGSLSHKFNPGGGWSPLLTHVVENIMPSERELADEVFQIKGRLEQGVASETDRELLRVALACEHPLVRLMAASVAIAQRATEFSDAAQAIISSAIAGNQIGGAFPQLLFWEAMAFVPLDRIDHDSLLDVVEAHVADPRTPRVNVAFVLRRLASKGSSRAASLLPRYEPS